MKNIFITAAVDCYYVKRIFKILARTKNNIMDRQMKKKIIVN